MALDKEKIRQMMRERAGIKNGGPSPIHPEVLLESMTIEGVEVDFCPKSHGIWLDQGEAADLSEGISDFPDFDWSWSHKVQSSKKSPRYPQENLWELPYSRDSDLKVDYCEKSKGIWLDAAEFARLEIIMADGTSHEDRISKLYAHMKANGLISLG